MKKITLCLLLIILSTHANAEWYQVEIIIFENLYPDTGGEQWFNNQNLPDIKNSVELVSQPLTDAGKLIPFLELSPGKYKLGGVYRALRLSKEYRPLLHKAWQQSGVSSQSRAKFVHIKYVEGESINSQVIEGQDSFYDPLVKLDGTVRLRGGHFLHLDIDLAYFFESVPESIIYTVLEDANTNFKLTDYTRLIETRKVKLNELHYFDHPLYGVLMMVRRLKVE